MVRLSKTQPTKIRFLIAVAGLLMGVVATLAGSSAHSAEIRFDGDAGTATVDGILEDEIIGSPLQLIG